MSNKRITDLTELTTPTTDDVLPIVDIATNTTQKVQLANLPVQTAVTTALATKQDTLVSGTNIKTLNSVSLLGTGNIVLAATPSGVAGAIQFSNGSAFASDATNLFWDDTNNRLGIGTNTPNSLLNVIGTGGVSGIRVNTSGADSWMPFSDGNWYVRSNGVIINDNNTAGVSIGTNSPNTARLMVKGSGSTSATTSLLVQNSGGTAALTITDSGLSTFTGTVRNTTGPMEALSFANQGAPFNFSTASIYNITGTAPVVTSGQRDGFLGQFTFAPTSGTAVLNVMNASPTINQTGGANGITRGLYINPTLTAAADFRAIQTTAGKIIFGGLPTSSAGLVSGQLWNDAGTLKIA